MPTVTVQGKTFTCDHEANLRRVLLQHEINLHNGKSKVINCQGLGSCGTCAVEIIGKVSPANWKDKTRRSLPPHSRKHPRQFLYAERYPLGQRGEPPQRTVSQNRRLACQTKVLGDIEVIKYDGFWGQGESIINHQRTMAN